MQFYTASTSLHLPVDAEVELGLVCCKGKKISCSAANSPQSQYIFLTGQHVCASIYQFIATTRDLPTLNLMLGR